MKVQVQKWGNSLALRIPQSLAVETGIKVGSTVEINVEKKAVVIRPEKDDIDLEDLLSRITAGNLHSKVNFGEPAGREIL